MAFDNNYQQKHGPSHRCGGRVTLSFSKHIIKYSASKCGFQLSQAFWCKGQIIRAYQKVLIGTQYIMSDILTIDRDRSARRGTTPGCTSEGTSSSKPYPEVPASTTTERKPDAREHSDARAWRFQNWVKARCAQIFGHLLFKCLGGPLKQYQTTAYAE
jgi:hypothetical protein